jgi:hypothetical protein
MFALTRTKTRKEKKVEGGEREREREKEREKKKLITPFIHLHLLLDFLVCFLNQNSFKGDGHFLFVVLLKRRTAVDVESEHAVFEVCCNVFWLVGPCKFDNVEDLKF